MLPFYSDILDTFDAIKDLFLGKWDALPPPTRILVALTMALGLMYLGSKVEQAGWSTILMFSSFGLLVYVLVLSFHVIH